MTLVIVLMFGFGTVLITSAIETDKATGKSVSIVQTIQDIWSDRLDFSQPNAATNGGGAGGGFAYQPPSPSTSTLLSYQQASTADYLKQRAV